MAWGTRARTEASSGVRGLLQLTPWGMMVVWTRVVPVEVFRSSQMLDTLSKWSLQDLLTGWMCGVKEFEESGMTPLVLA